MAVKGLIVRDLNTTRSGVTKTLTTLENTGKKRETRRSI